MKYTIICLLGGLVGWAGLSATASAQAYGRVEDITTNAGAYRYFTQPGVTTAQVQVLGMLQSPGLYETSVGTDLGQLLAIAGGPTIGSRGRSERRDVVLRLYRKQLEGRTLVYERTLEQAVTDPDGYPVLQDGDVVLVEVVERRRFSWRDALSIISGAATLALAIERFARIN